jgi:hypothetical protein
MNSDCQHVDVVSNVLVMLVDIKVVSLKMQHMLLVLHLCLCESFRRERERFAPL